MKPKKCKQCKILFTPTKQLQFICGFECAKNYALDLKAKRDKKETKEKLDKLKTKSQWLKEAQTIFNQFIRLRDGNYPCISCNRWHTGQYHAGHYRSVGSAPHLRFNEFNCHRQCSVCNNHLSGNQINYRQGLILKIGLSEVERLESDNEPKKYTIDDIKQIKLNYKQKIKEYETNKNVT